MATGDVYRVAFLYSVHGQGCANILYMKQTGAAGDDAQDAASILAPLLTQVYFPVLPRGAVQNTINVGVTLVSKSNSDQGGASGDLASQGPNTGAFPALCASVIRIRTGLAGRTRRGRIFLSGVSLEWSTAGVLNANGILGYDGFMTRLSAGFMGPNPQSGFQLGVFSRTVYSGLLGTLADAFKPAISLQNPVEIASMRSRKVGVGQ